MTTLAEMVDSIPDYKYVAPDPVLVMKGFRAAADRVLSHVNPRTLHSFCIAQQRAVYLTDGTWNPYEKDKLRTTVIKTSKKVLNNLETKRIRSEKSQSRASTILSRYELELEFRKKERAA